MNQRIVDAAERAAAIDPARSFIVQAPAGSGKTELLTQRMLRLLALVDAPEEILAITFTRKAAGEMRERVLDALRAASAPQPEEAHKRQTWLLARAALERDAGQQWGLTDNPARLRIQTFDSLALRLARQLPLLSGLAGAAPSEDAGELYRQAALATLAALEEPQFGPLLASLLRHQDNDFERVAGLLTEMLARRDQWLPVLAPDNPIQALQEALRSRVEERLQAIAGAFPEPLRPELLQLASFAAGNLPPEHPLAAWRDLAGWPACHADALPLWQALLPLLVTQDGTPRRSWDIRVGFPAPGSTQDKQQKELLTSAKQQIAELLARLTADAGFSELLQELRQLPPTSYQPGQAALLGQLRDILLRAVAELQLLFQQYGRIDFPECTLRALTALGADSDVPTDLALALDYRLRHLLVDEVQDTSNGQFGLLRALTRGWSPADGHSLFLVGDPMQSIYRFRKAEVGLFLRAWEQGLGDLALQPLRLQTNFRSRAGVVDWVNRHFAGILPARPDAALGAVPYSPASAHHPDDPDTLVQIHPLPGDDGSAEADLVLQLIEAAQRRGDASIAVLVRGKRHLAEILPRLKGRVSFQGVDLDPLGSTQVVRDLLTLYRASLHPADRLAWLALLRAPWCGLRLQDLATLAEGEHRSLPELLQATEVMQRLDPAAAARARYLAQLMAAHWRNRQRRPVATGLKGLWLALGGPACLLDAAELEAAEAFFRLLEQQAAATPGGEPEPERLLQALERLFAPADPQASGQLQIMTMHKAKGLEFDTVILAGLGRATGRDREPLLEWKEWPGPAGDTRLVIAPIKAHDGDKEPIYTYLRTQERAAQRLEAARLLYVAATRARRQLHLVAGCPLNAEGTLARPLADSLLWHLWPTVEGAFAAEVATSRNELPAMPAAPPLQRLAAVPTRPDLPLSVTAAPVGETATVGTEPIAFDWAGETARHIGTLTHRYLALIAQQGLEYWNGDRLAARRPAIALGLAQLGVLQEELATATGLVLEALGRTLADPHGRWLLLPHFDAECELALVVADNGRPRTLVIDRTFVDDDGMRWIVDYKTGRHQGADIDAFLDQEVARYRGQLAGYASAFGLLEQRPLRLALYFPLLRGWREWSP